MRAKNNLKFKMTKKGIIFLFAVLVSALSFNAEAQDRCLNVCPAQGALINVSGEDPDAINGVVCIDNLTGDNHIIQNGAELGNLPEALYTCYTVAVSNNSGSNFDIASASYSIGNVQTELDMALLGIATNECGSVSPAAKTFDVNSSYCESVGGTCMLNLCSCVEGAGTDFVFEYVPADNEGDTEELFIVVDAGGSVVAVSSSSPISAAGLAEGSYEIYAVIYDPAKAGNLAGLLSAGNALADIESELSSTACGTISAAVNASVDADACGCERVTGLCVTEVCECNGDANEIKLSTDGYTADGNNQQWYIVVSGGNIVTSQQAAADGSVIFSGLPDGSHQVYAVNYDPTANANVTTGLADGNAWSDFTAGVTNGAFCAAYTDSQDISINGMCDCPFEVDIDISDPCSCTSTGNIDLDGDGNIDLVDDVITINSPEGYNWCITNNPSPQALDNAGNPISDGTCATEVNPGIYELVVYHPADGTGYGPVAFESASGTGAVLSLSVDNLAGCNCMTVAECIANEGSVTADGGDDFCDNDDTTLNIEVGGNENGADYSTIVLITTDNPLTSDIYDIVGIAEASPGMYNLGTGSAATYNVLGLDPGNYCIHSFNFLTSDFNPMNELQILNSSGGFISSIDALLALTGTAGNLPICGAITSTACDAFTIYPEISFDANLSCDAADLDNYSVDVINISGGNGAVVPDVVISDGSNSYVLGEAIPNDTEVTITVSDGICSTSTVLNGNCLDLDCPASATADASNPAACGGSSIVLSVNNVIGDSGLSTSDYSVSWSSSDASIDVSNAGNVSLSNATCLAEEVTFTATLTCSDGSSSISADVNVTIYPNEIQSFVSSTGEGSCDPRVVVEDPCNGVILTGTRTPANIGPDQSGDAAWDLIYVFQGNNTPALGACSLSGSYLVPYQCAPVCPTAVQFNINDVEVCSGGAITLPNLDDAISSLNATGNLYADYSWTSTDGFSSDSGEVQEVALTNDECAPKEVVFTYEITCALDGSAVRTGDFTATVYPTDISSFVQVEGEGECLVSLTPIASCGLYITADNFLAQPGEEGTTTLSVTYAVGGCDVTYSADVNYFCEEPITCDAGTISGGAISYVCNDEFAIATTTGSDGFLNYVLHDGDDTSIGTVLATSFTGVFTNDGTLPVNMELCISAVAGSDQGPDGSPDPNGTCYDISECSRVVFLTPMVIDFTQDCDETTGLVEVSYTITGGAPEFLPAVHTYDIIGTDGHENDGASGESYVLGNFAVEGTAVNISVSDDGKNCSADVVEEIVIRCDELEVCDAGTVGSGAINFVCDGEFAVFSAVETIGNIAYVLHDGDDNALGTIYSTSTSGVFVNDGALPTNVELCVSSVAGSEVDASGIPDPDGTCYDISECAPVVFLTPITVEVEQVCDATTGLVDISYTISGGAPEFLPNVHSYMISGPAGYTNEGASGETYVYEEVSPNQDFSFSIDDDGKNCSSGFDFTSIDCGGVPAITIDKIADASGVTEPAEAGQVINYSFIVCNTGDVDLTDVSVADDLVAVSGGPISLAVGECDETTFTASYTLTDADIAAANVVNSATVSGTAADGTVVTDKDIETVDLFIELGEPAISIDKIADASGVTDPAVAGQVINYSFTVCNVGGVDLTNVSVADDLVAVSGGPISLAVGECDETTFTASYTITAADITATEVVNSATASGTYTAPDGSEEEVNDKDIETVPLQPDTFVAVPEITLDKIADASGVTDPALVGQVINYSFTVCNTGNVDLTNVTVADDLVAVSGGPISLAVDECDETTFTASYTITAADITATEVVNSATASGTYTAPDGSEEEVNDKDIETVELMGIDPMPAISIDKIADASGVTDPAVVGQVINYSFTVCNTGNVDLTNVTVADDLVAVSGGPISLAVDECDETTFTASYVITAADITAEEVVNSAVTSGTYTAPDGTETEVNDNDVETVPLMSEPPMPAITLDKIADASGVTNPAVAGQVISYNFTVCNTGNVDLTNVNISDNLITVAGSISLAVGECDATSFTASYAITDADIEAGGVNNTATVTGTAPDGTNMVTDTDEVTVPLIPLECNNDAGVMPSTALNACSGNFANAPTAGASIDAGSVLTYVLHNGVGSSLGTTIDYNNTGLFLNGGLYPTGIQLYICAVVSPDTGSFPNLDNDCTDISDNCTPVTFLSQVDVNVEVDCGQTGNYTVIFEVSGGLPDSQTGGLYSVSGDFTGLVEPNTPTTVGPFNAGTFYTLNISDNNGCGANVVSQQILCEKLPIELISYTGEAQAQGNLLKWVTASEIENDYFTLERSTDGINFELINTQKGAGTTGDIQSYNHLDREAPNGISYYKLWQTDMDGTLNYVGLIALSRGEANLAINSLLPIPVLQYLELTYTSISESQVELQIYDALGKQLGSKTVSANIGLNIEELDVSVYSPGMYFLTINQGDTTITEKFIKE